jgi:hypothetical protein
LRFLVGSKLKPIAPAANLAVVLGQQRRERFAKIPEIQNNQENRHPEAARQSAKDQVNRYSCAANVCLFDGSLMERVAITLSAISLPFLYLPLGAIGDLGVLDPGAGHGSSRPALHMRLWFLCPVFIGRAVGMPSAEMLMIAFQLPLLGDLINNREYCKEPRNQNRTRVFRCNRHYA